MGQGLIAPRNPIVPETSVVISDRAQRWTAAYDGKLNTETTQAFRGSAESARNT